MGKITTDPWGMATHGPNGGQQAWLPASACLPWTLCCHHTGDVLVWGMLLCKEGMSQARTQG